MARIRLMSPGQYNNSAAIAAEFESIIRYLNVAEIGDHTIGELLAKLFDDNGDFDGPIEIRANTSVGLQYRVGEYSATEDEEGWTTIMTYADLRGPAGSSVGTVEGPLFYNKQEFVATASQTVFSYTFDDSTDDILVFTNGVLEAEANYTADASANTVTFGSGRTVSDVVTIYSIRTQSVTNYRRSDITSTAGQAVFAFVHTEDEQLLVYVNGILQREGGANDYTSSASSNTITFTAGLSNGDLVSIFTVENSALQNVGGLMLEDEYTNADGLIPYAKLAFADGDIPQAKISGLVAALTNVKDVFISATTPTGMAAGDLWVDTSATPNTLKFYDGSNWILTSPESALPTFTSSDANKLLHVNGTGTAMEWADYDASALVPKTYMGAANGVASLDSDARLPTAQLPDIFSLANLSIYESGAVSNGTLFVARLWKSTVQIDGIAFKLASGTCDIQISVDGVTVGSVYNVSSSLSQQTLSSVIEIDATSSSRRLEIEVTNQSSANSLEVGLAVATTNA